MTEKNLTKRNVILSLNIIVENVPCSNLYINISCNITFKIVHSKFYCFVPWTKEFFWLKKKKSFPYNFYAVKLTSKRFLTSYSEIRFMKLGPQKFHFVQNWPFVRNCITLLCTSYVVFLSSVPVLTFTSFPCGKPCHNLFMKGFEFFTSRSYVVQDFSTNIVE